MFHLVVQEEQLPNGMRVVVHPDARAGQVVACLGFDVGADADPVDQPGLAHLLEHLRFRSGGFESRLAAVGGTSNGWTDHDRMVVWAAAPPESLPLLVEWAGWTAMTGEWAEGDVDAERSVVAAEQAGMTDRAHGRDRERLAELLWGDFPYGRSVHGVPRADSGAMRTFAAQNFPPSHATLVVAGAVEAAAAFAEVHRVVWDAGWSRVVASPASIGSSDGSIAPQPPRPQPLNLPPQRIWMADDVGETSILAAWRTVPQVDSARPALDILAALVGAETNNARWSGSFSIEAERPAEIRRLRRRLRRTYADAQIAGVRADMSLRWARAIDGVVGRAQSLVTCALATGNPDCLPTEWEKYAAVTSSDLAAAAASISGEPDVLLAVVPGSVGHAPLPRMDRW